MITVKEDKNQYQKEHDELLTFLLEKRFFQPWRTVFTNDVDYQRSLAPDTKLELYLTSTCNQNCEYCYLIKHKELYPKEYNNPEIIKANLRKIFQWMIDNKFTLRTMDFFTGEIWHSQFGLDVLDILLEYLSYGLQVKSVLIPSNCSFILDEIQTCEIQRRINRAKKYDCVLIFSISVDGAVIEEKMRPLNNKVSKTDEFYERLFLFAKHNNFLFHPMVAAKSSKDWIENYQWWIKKFEEYDMDLYDMMMLEVRNNDWEQEDIDAYNAFMKYLIDYDIQHYCHGDLDRYANEVISFDDCHHGYIPWVPVECDTFAGCTVADTLTVRVGDLAIAPCHRTAYDKFLYGHFIVENDKIVGIKANNIFMAIRILMANNNISTLGCDTCLYNECCLKGCFGSQYEQNNDPFIPIPGVCNFFKQKWRYIINYYNELGILDRIKEKMNPYQTNYIHAKAIYDWCLKVLEDSKNVGKV